MAINLKKEEEITYYYTSAEGIQFGPFSLKDLLTKIGPHTLVWREGIKWTNANSIKELKNYFSSDLSNLSTLSNIIFEQGGGSLSSKMFIAPFQFNGRIRRKEYVISLIIYIAGLVSILLFIQLSSVFTIAYIPLLWFIWAPGAKRCHDRSISGWYQLIPFYALWMIFDEAYHYSNEYGE